MDIMVEIICVLGALDPETLSQMGVPICSLDQHVLTSRLDGSFRERISAKLSLAESASPSIYDNILVVAPPSSISTEVEDCERAIDLLCDILKYIPRDRPSARELILQV